MDKKVWRKAWLRGQRRRTSKILPQIKISWLLPGNVDVLSIIFSQGKEDCSLVKLPDNVAKQFTWANQHKRLRDGWRHQNGWIFGKVPNSFWPPPSFSESYIANFLNWLRSLQKMEPIETSIWGFRTAFLKMYLVLIFINTIVEKHNLKRPLCINFMVK